MDLRFYPVVVVVVKDDKEAKADSFPYFEADQRYVRTEEESVRNDNNDGIPTSLSIFDIDQRYLY